MLAWKLKNICYLGKLQKGIPGEVLPRRHEGEEGDEGNSTVVEYVAKFEGLSKYYVYYQGEIKEAINYLEIFQFPILVNRCRIYDEDNQAKATYYKGTVGRVKGSNLEVKAGISLIQLHPYGLEVAFREWKDYLKCGCSGHLTREYANKEMTCFNYCEQGHITRSCMLPKRESPSVERNAQSSHAKTIERVLTLSVSKLKLVVSFLKYKLVETLANSSIVTLNVLDRDFLVDLVCLSFSQLDITLDKIVVFGTLIFDKDERFITANQAKMFLKENTQAYTMLSSLKVEKCVVVGAILVVGEFLEVFPEDVSSLLPKREIEFSIDLVLGTGSISTTAYRMSPLELAELKKLEMRLPLDPREA
ncbi:hypothetical protein CR513_30624, partial [Mucuna pruriens]